MSYFGTLSGYGLAPRRPPPVERKVLLLHGTTVPRAQSIIRQGGMSPGRAFFAMGMSNRDLARIFAERASQRSPRAGGPALLLTTVPESDFERIRRAGLVKAIPFDAADRPDLRLRRQWVVEPGGIELLNRAAEDWRMVRMRR